MVGNPWPNHQEVCTCSFIIISPSWCPQHPLLAQPRALHFHPMCCSSWSCDEERGLPSSMGNHLLRQQRPLQRVANRSTELCCKQQTRSPLLLLCPITHRLPVPVPRVNIWVLEQWGEKLGTWVQCPIWQQHLQPFWIEDHLKVHRSPQRIDRIVSTRSKIAAGSLEHSDPSAHKQRCIALPLIQETWTLDFQGKCSIEGAS